MQQYGSIAILVVLFGLMYFFMIRPQKKQQQKHQATLKSLQKGDHVVTIGRLHGVVSNIDRAKGLVTIDCDGIYLDFDLNAIANVTRPEATVAPKAEEKPAEATEKTDDEAK